MSVKLLSHVRLFATPWTAAYQAPPSMGFSRQEYWSGLPFRLILNMKLKLLVAHSCLTLYDPMSCSLPGSSVLGISQARILEWVAISFSRGSSRLKDQTQVFCIVGRFFYHQRHQGMRIIQKQATSQTWPKGCRFQPLAYTSTCQD